MQEVWRVVEMWWRETPVRRTYYQLALEEGRTVTLFHDDAEVDAAGWYEQRY